MTAAALAVQHEQAHHETRRAEAALRAVAFDHGALRRVQRAVSTRDVGGGEHGHALHAVRQADAAVDGAVAELAVAAPLGQRHGAGAAVAAGAALLDGGAVQVVTQHVEQRAVGRHVGQRLRLAAQDEAQDGWTHARQYGAKTAARPPHQRLPLLRPWQGARVPKGAHGCYIASPPAINVTPDNYNFNSCSRLMQGNERPV